MLRPLFRTYRSQWECGLESSTGHTLPALLTVLIQLRAVPLARPMHAPPTGLRYVGICGAVFIVAYNLVVNSLGLISSAGVGVAEKLCAFIMLAPSAYIQSMSAFVAQNIGAGKPGRAKRVLFCRILSSLAAGVGMAYFSFFHSELTASLFANDRNVIFAAADYMRACAIDCILTFCRSHCAPDICCCLRNGAPISRRKICFECRGR